MTYSLYFSPEAQSDLFDSINWYNQEKENLGFKFYDALEEKINLLVDKPQQSPVRFNEIRAAKLNGFPYLIYFRIDQNKFSIVILGVLHTSRNPNIIRRRK